MEYLWFRRPREGARQGGIGFSSVARGNDETAPMIDTTLSPRDQADLLIYRRDLTIRAAGISCPKSPALRGCVVRTAGAEPRAKRAKVLLKKALFFRKIAAQESDTLHPSGTPATVSSKRS